MGGEGLALLGRGHKIFIFRGDLPCEGGGNFLGGGSYPSAYYGYTFVVFYPNNLQSSLHPHPHTPPSKKKVCLSEKILEVVLLKPDRGGGI